jgi:very-short-patch-repair endonuclease
LHRIAEPQNALARDSFPAFGEAKLGCTLPPVLILTEIFVILCLVIMMKGIRNGYLTERAQELRKNATEQERHLWYAFLHAYPVRFRRQVPIDRFIVDFVCSRAKMVLELDGSQHFVENGPAYDKERDAILESRGYKVFRITNSELDDNFDGVCEWIDRTVRERMKSRTKK